MQTFMTHMVSWLKPSAKEAWKLSFFHPSQQKVVMVSVGNRGVVVGPRLAEVLSSIEKRIPHYPYELHWQDVKAEPHNEYQVQWVGDTASYIEMSFSTYRHYHRYPHEFGIVQSSGIREVISFETSPSDTSGDTLRSKDYLIVGEFVQVKDGDTLEIRVVQAGIKASQDIRITSGNIIPIRLVGIQIPEAKESGEGIGNQKNFNYAAEFYIPLEETYQIGKEVKEFIQDRLTAGNSLVIVDVDGDEQGHPVADAYGRFLGVVYKARIAHAGEVFDKEEIGYAVSLNKTLLTSKSKQHAHVPLAIPYIPSTNEQGYRRFDVLSWLRELGLAAPSTPTPTANNNVQASSLTFSISANEVESGGSSHTGNVGDVFKAPKGDAPNPSNKEINADPVEIIYGDPPSNRIDFLVPYDDRLEQRVKDPLSKYRVRIGDVDLVIPPLSIQVNRTSNMQKIKTLRSKSSIIFKVGSSMTTLTLELYFHDLDSINGYPVERPTKDGYYYMDGLRPLIAQFKKAPFLPIDNEFINETLGIHNVALVDLSVRTVPGFPHCLAATLTLAKFEIQAYMPQVTYLGSVINYPLFRWYYQEPMNDKHLNNKKRSPYRTWLYPIKSPIDNTLTFQIADEESLQERVQAIKQIRTNDPPTVFREKLEGAETELGRLIKDGQNAQIAKKQWQRWKDGQEDYIVGEENTRFYPPKAVEGIRIQFNNQVGGPGGPNIFEYAPVDILDEKWDKGYFCINLYTSVNLNEIPASYRGGEGKFRGEIPYITVFIPVSEAYRLDPIIERGYKAQEAAEDYIKEYQRLSAIVEAAEGHVRLVNYDIKGQYVVTSINVMYQNEFSMAQVQLTDSPALQYLGIQDPYIQIVIEADQDAVESIREMLEITERYSREYRIGITSGFLGVRNPLIQLFGVETVIPEVVNIHTVPGYPGRFQIEMTLCGFNKTQKRTEKLEGISPIYGVPDMKDIHASEFNPASQEAVIERKMMNLEAYPDLELPTYDELNAVIGKLGIGMQEYRNYGNGKYLDPDFYIATDWTFREDVIKQRHNQAHHLDLKDTTGIQMYTNNQMGKLIEADEDNWAAIQALDEKVEQVGIDKLFSGEKIEGSLDIAPLDLTTWDPLANQPKEPVMDPMGAVNRGEVEKWLKDSSHLYTAPSFNELVQWGVIASGQIGDYQTWLKQLKQPREEQVYSFIYHMVDRLWVDGGFVFNDKKLSKKSEAWEKVTYAKNEDFWAAYYNRLKETDAKHLINEKEVALGSLSVEDLNKVAPGMTRERIANLLKAIFDVQSDWRQMTANNMPIYNAKTTEVGIGGISLRTHAVNPIMAKRLAWDWRYNLEYAIRYLYKLYTQAATHRDINIASRPWDWMIYAYAMANKVTDKKNAGAASSFYSQVLGTFQSKYNSSMQRFASPTTANSIAILGEVKNLTPHQEAIIRGEKEALLEELKATDYGKKELEKLKKKTALEVADAYEKHMKKLFPLDGKQPGIVYGGIYDTYMTTIVAKHMGNQDKYKEQFENYLLYKQFREDAQKLENYLLFNDDPYTIYEEMFTDLEEYDQRGRLVRAYPTFQMFIIDEGRWMANYRLWDNLYGFNAIRSIDIHKSRKSAADTAVIEMTNVYSNLTSYPVTSQFEEHHYDWWDNLVMGRPNEKLLEARKQLLTSMMLQPGARIHLRLGYGSCVPNLPIVFNGTITDMEVDEVVRIVALGDGYELTNIVSPDPDDENTKWGQIIEPRDLICELLTSKGNWLRNVINWTTDNRFFKDNPLGIQHFGWPGKTPPGNVFPFNSEYGEAAQNIYSTNGFQTFSQWAYSNGEPIGWGFDGIFFKPKGDEANVKISLYNKTVYDIVQIMAAVTPDYIAAVHPFELRSTLFFGKPYYRMVYRYSSRYTYNKETKQWERYITQYHRKPFMQFRFYDSKTDIIQNRIKATADNMYNAVVVRYDDEVTPTIYADYDINFSQQKLTIVEAPIIARFGDFWTSKRQAINYGCSVLRDYMKDMYDGYLLVLGDPTVKPYDMMYINDDIVEMRGNCLVKEVIHHFSHETGFVTRIKPDALVVIDDRLMLSLANWAASCFVGFAMHLATRTMVSFAYRKFTRSAIGQKVLEFTKETLGDAKTLATEKSLERLLNSVSDDLKNSAEYQEFKQYFEAYRNAKDPAQKSKYLNQMIDAQNRFAEKVKNTSFVDANGNVLKGEKFRHKRLVWLTKGIITSLKQGGRAARFLRSAGAVAGLGSLAGGPLTIGAFIVTEAASFIVSESLAEMYRRKKTLNQAVIIYPLKYKDRFLEAGILGHSGLVVGDKPRKDTIDNFYAGLGFNGKEDNDFFELIGEFFNWWAGEESGEKALKQFYISEEDLMNGDIYNRK